MSGFIEDLQMELVSSAAPIGSILLKLRLLAAKLGSAELEEWVKREAEGYPSDADLPDYRIFGISFSGSFSGPFGREINNAPIPPIFIREFAGEQWLTHKMRYSAAALERLAEEKEGIGLDLSNLMILLRGKVYPGFEPIQIKGYVASANLVEAANAIRNRLLQVLIEVERRIPEANGAVLGAIQRRPDVATQIFHQTFHGSTTNIQSSGDFARISVRIAQADKEGLKLSLQEAGLGQVDAITIADIIASEKPESRTDGLGTKARRWLADRMTQGADAGIKGGLAALTALVQEAAMQFYGLK